MPFSGVVSRYWNLYLPSRRLLTRPAASSTSRCCEIACRDNPSSCFIVSLVQSSNRVWPSRSWSSSRIARLAGAASAWKTSLNAAIIGKRLLAYGRCRALATRGRCSAHGTTRGRPAKPRDVQAADRHKRRHTVARGLPLLRVVDREQVHAAEA